MEQPLPSIYFQTPSNSEPYHYINPDQKRKVIEYFQNPKNITAQSLKELIHSLKMPRNQMLIMIVLQSHIELFPKAVTEIAEQLIQKEYYQAHNFHLFMGLMDSLRTSGRGDLTYRIFKAIHQKNKQSANAIINRVINKDFYKERRGEISISNNESGMVEDITLPPFLVELFAPDRLVWEIESALNNITTPIPSDHSIHNQMHSFIDFFSNAFSDTKPLTQIIASEINSIIYLPKEAVMTYLKKGGDYSIVKPLVDLWQNPRLDREILDILRKRERPSLSQHDSQQLQCLSLF